MDFLTGLVGFFGTFGNWALTQLRTILGWARGLVAKLASHLGIFKSLLGSVLSHLHKLWGALAGLHLSDLWRELQKAYTRFQSWLAWWQKHIQEPIDRIRRQLDQLYAAIFGPIIKFIDALRGPLRILALFNRKLAAELDHFLFGLEQKVMAPFLAIYQRLNALSSSIRAVITTLGYLDRVLLVESIRRDASIIWQVLTNPRAAIFDKPSHVAPRTIAQTDADFKVYTQTGAGDLAVQVAALDDTFTAARLALGV